MKFRKALKSLWKKPFLKKVARSNKLNSVYNLPYHKETNDQIIEDFIMRYPLAMLISATDNAKPVATQIPVFLEKEDGKKLLRGHIYKQTDHYGALLENKNVLFVFSGKNTYVSGTWYSDPNTASTWNYMSVHVRGKLSFLAKSGLETLLQKTSLHFEGGNESSPTIFSNLPEEFKKRVIDLIAGFEVEITEIDTVFKLSQDRDEESYENIIEKLSNGSHDAQVIADEMRKRKEELFR